MHPRNHGFCDEREPKWQGSDWTTRLRFDADLERLHHRAGVGTDVAGALTIAGAVTTGIIIGVALAGSGSSDSTEPEKTAVTLKVAPTGVALEGWF